MRAEGKRPLGQWQEYQHRLPTDEEWERTRRHAEQGGGVFLVCGGVSGVAVLDLDSADAIEDWKQRLGDGWSRTPRAKTPRGGYHLFFALNGRTGVRSQSGEGWDLRAEGAGVVLPCGNGKRAWEGSPSGELPGFEADLDGGRAESSSSATADGGGLAGLLVDPPAEGQRNDWLARVAGHYARLLDRWGDFEFHVRQAATRLDPPLPDSEIAKLLPSIWSAEDRKFERDVEGERRKLHVREEAQARLRAEEFQPPESTADLIEELEKPDPEVRWSVEELAPAEGAVLLAAQYKTGKTTLALNLAKALADEQPFLGFAATHLTGRVAIWNREMAAGEYRLWLRRMNIGHPERAAVLHLRGESNPLSSTEGVEWTTQWLARREVGFWILDTYGALFAGDDENDNSQVRRFLTTLDEIRSGAGVEALLLVAHTGRKRHDHGEEHVRGATVLDDWTDARWSLTEDAGTRYLQAHGRDVDFEESDLAYDFATYTYALGEGRSRAFAAHLEKDDERRALAVESARGQGGLSKRELRSRMKGGGRNDKRADAIEHAALRGELVCVGGLYYVPGEEPGAGQGRLDA